MYRPLFSIATSCLNSEKTIERTIKSVLAQTFTDYEYIIVDGGSTDGTLDIIMKYEPLFKGRMRWYSEPDKGIYDAFNKGVKHSNGYFCWNVNSDDWIESEALSELYSIADNCKNTMTILCCRMKMHKNSGCIMSQLVTLDRISAAGEGLTRMGITHPASVFSHDVYDNIGLYDDRYYISGDIDHFIRSYRSRKVAFLPVDRVIINMSDNGISNTFNLKKVNHDWSIRFSKFCTSPIMAFKLRLICNLRYIKNFLVK